MKPMTNEQRQNFNKRTGMNREERRRMIRRWKADKTLEVCPACGYRTPRKQTEEGIIYCALCKYIIKPTDTRRKDSNERRNEEEGR